MKQRGLTLVTICLLLVGCNNSGYIATTRTETPLQAINTTTVQIDKSIFHSTATAEVRTVAKTATLAQYRNANPYLPEPQFEVSYDPALWSLDQTLESNDRLLHRTLKNCDFRLQAGPLGAPAVDKAQLADREWTIALVQPNILLYWFSYKKIGFDFGLVMPMDYSAAEKQPCQVQAEKVIDTFQIIEPATTPVATPISVPSHSIKELKPQGCILSIVGMMTGTANFEDQSIDGSFATIIYDGGATQAEKIYHGAFTAPILAKRCDSGLKPIGFQLTIGEWRQYIKLTGTDLELIIHLQSAPEQVENVSEHAIILGTISGMVRKAGQPVPDGMEVTVYIGGGLQQTVFTRNGIYSAPTIGDLSDGIETYLPVTVSIGPAEVSIAPSLRDMVQDVDLP